MYVNVNFQHRPGVPGPPILSRLVIFIFFSIRPTDRPNIRKRMQRLNEKKGGWPY